MPLVTLYDVYQSADIPSTDLCSFFGKLPGKRLRDSVAYDCPLMLVVRRRVSMGEGTGGGGALRRTSGGGGDGALRRAEYDVGADHDRRLGYDAGAAGARRRGDEYELQPPPPPRRRAERRRVASQVSAAML